MKNMKKLFCILTVALLSFALLAGCGSSGDKLSDRSAIEAYGTMIWGDELIDVCFTHDQEKIYIYYDDGDYALFETVDLPVEDFRTDEYWRITYADLNDVTGNGYSDLRVYIDHLDKCESSIFWTWSENAACYVYQPTNSFFYISNVIYGPPADDLSMYEGIWLADEDNMYDNLYIVIDWEGNWQLYSGGDIIDEGYLYESEGDGTYVYSYNTGALDGGCAEMRNGWLYISTAGYFTRVDEIVVDETPSVDFSVYEGAWIADEDNLYPSIFITFDLEGNWQLYSGSDLMDEGYLYISEGDGIYVYSYNTGALDGGCVEMEDGRLYISTAGHFTHVD